MDNYQVGDLVSIKTENTQYIGIVMPSLDEDILVIKMKNGYNVGISKRRIVSIEKIEGSKTPKYRKPEVIFENKGNLKNISILSTGGTVASRVDYNTGAVHPAFTAEDLILAFPELLEIGNILGRPLMNILSENILPLHWKRIAEEIKREVENGAEGIVITHGTDTMHYTAAALSFMVETNIPVVLVGAQRSSDRPSSDAPLNLISAVMVATEPIKGVYVVMHGESGDTFTYLHEGVKVRKYHTSRRDAFRSVNTIPIAKIYPTSRRIEYIREVNNKVEGEDPKVEINTNLEERVALIKIYPGIEGDIIDYYVDKGYKGILLEGTGLGHAPETIFNNIKYAIDSGLLVAMASQCINGRVNMNVYSNGRKLLRLGVIPCEDMLPEVALVKMMYLLGNYSVEEAKKLLTENLKGEITLRTRFDCY
ncbi:Glu-tRNA(Gln) amidotransferase subunit GatD [Methanofervidicoccus abyssi]|uniref:Glutamyl-tRNA(Gln) amidotransferase subunit D n=1 Tax=Methanofervidicoccus abyssi TaxID=2082189 RepID=A0A401HNJ0_9EURY|nr:Glu-tRNA(Gln) amidotransferase subunit GatD [Methanofervidicoccus abyssi]GBF35800.1 glutamyl-tRNA(Gln) amidotransferase subunit D [Methanofervidicoccus abyssi]